MLSLDCRHTMCQECLDAQLNARWPGSRMTFGYLRCGVCRTSLGHESVQYRLKGHWQLRRQVVDVAVQRFQQDGLDTELRGSLGRAATAEEEEAHAEAQMVVYPCKDCNKPYCAGQAHCADALVESAKDLRCSGCEWAATRAVGGDRRCTVHGPSFAIYKCDFCCSLAVWQCGATHFCEPCHSGGSLEKPRACPGPGRCPLGIRHPPNGACEAGFVFGWTACCGCTDANPVIEYDVSDYGDYDDYDDSDDADDFVAAKLQREESRTLARRRKAARSAQCAANNIRLMRMGRQTLRRGGRHKVSKFDLRCDYTIA